MFSSYRRELTILGVKGLNKAFIIIIIILLLLLLLLNMKAILNTTHAEVKISTHAVLYQLS